MLSEAMKTTTTPDLAMRRWTRAEYDRMISLGVFQPEERLELLDGWQIDSQLPIALDDLSEPEPDVSVVPGTPESYLEEHPSHPLLIIEVAESSSRIDGGYKASLYARAAVPEYWIVDLVHETVEVHREPEASDEARYGWRYRSVETLRAPATVAPLLAPDRSIAVADLLP